MRRNRSCAKSFLHYKKSTESKSFISSVELYKNESETTFKKFNQLFSRNGKKKNQLKVTYFQYTLKPTQLKECRVPLHLLPAVNKELQRLISEGQIKKQKSSDEDRFISQIIIAYMKDKL